jgi:hypothetical protein
VIARPAVIARQVVIARPSGGNRRGGPGGFGRARRGRNFLKGEDIDYKDVQLMRRFVSERRPSGRQVAIAAGDRADSGALDVEETS